MGIDYVRIVLALLATLALGLGAIALIAWRGGRFGGRLPVASPAPIELLAMRPLGGRQALVAVRWRGREALLVVGPGHAHTVMLEPAAPAAPQP